MTRAPLPPLHAVTPDPAQLTYRDPDYGFTFQYPANWELEADSALRDPRAPGGTSIAVTNFTDAPLKGGLTPDQIKIEISVTDELAQYGTLDDWLAHEQQIYTSSQFTFSSVQHLTINHVPAIRWTINLPAAPQGIVQVALGKGKWLYTIDAYPASSKHIPTYNQIVASFQIP